MPATETRIAEILREFGDDILSDWNRNLSVAFNTDHRISQTQLSGETKEFLKLIQGASGSNGTGSVDRVAAEQLLTFLAELSRSRARRGFTSDETATFVFSFKKPLFDRLSRELRKNPNELVDEVWKASEFLDDLGLHTVKTFQSAREQIISRQQEELLELSTPVVKLWEGILALPLIGTLDSARTQIVMESLLQRIVETGASTAIIDITGVPTIDTQTAQHLMKTATAIRMMGADCIISGIRPQIAQTVVHLGVDLQGTTTKATLADALALALKRADFQVTRK